MAVVGFGMGSQPSTPLPSNWQASLFGPAAVRDNAAADAAGAAGDSARALGLGFRAAAEGIGTSVARPYVAAAEAIGAGTRAALGTAGRFAGGLFGIDPAAATPAPAPAPVPTAAAASLVPGAMAATPPRIPAAMPASTGGGMPAVVQHPTVYSAGEYKGQPLIQNFDGSSALTGPGGTLVKDAPTGGGMPARLGVSSAATTQPALAAADAGQPIRLNQVPALMALMQGTTAARAAQQQYGLKAELKTNIDSIDNAIANTRKTDEGKNAAVAQRIKDLMLLVNPAALSTSAIYSPNLGMVPTE